MESHPYDKKFKTVLDLLLVKIAILKRIIFEIIVLRIEKQNQGN